MSDRADHVNEPVLPSEQASADADDLRAGLAELADLVADTLGWGSCWLESPAMRCMPFPARMAPA